MNHRHQTITKTFAGHVPGAAIPSYDAAIDDVLDEARSPWGGGGISMCVAICGPDGETIYRVESIDGQGEFMGLVSGLRRVGMVDLIHGQSHPQFDAIFAPSPELLARATLLPPAPSQAPAGPTMPRH